MLTSLKVAPSLPVVRRECIVFCALLGQVGRWTDGREARAWASNVILCGVLQLSFLGCLKGSFESGTVNRPLLAALPTSSGLPWGLRLCCPCPAAHKAALRRGDRPEERAPSPAREQAGLLPGLASFGHEGSLGTVGPGGGTCPRAPALYSPSTSRGVRAVVGVGATLSGGSSAPGSVALLRCPLSPTGPLGPG